MGVRLSPRQSDEVSCRPEDRLFGRLGTALNISPRPSTGSGRAETDHPLPLMVSLSNLGA